MPKVRDDSTKARLYTRKRSKKAPPRYYADFRDYSDVGGSLESLAPEDGRFATTCPEEAEQIAEARLDELKKKRARMPKGSAAARILEKLIPDHLEMKAKLGEGGAQWLGNVQVHLETAEGFFGEHCDIATITPRDVQEYHAHLRKIPNGRGGTMSSGSIAHYLNSLSNLFKRAIADGLIPMDHNPVRAIKGPTITRTETPFLEIPEIVEILRFALEEYEPARPDQAIPFFPVILAVQALTGLREAEALGLHMRDVNLEREIIRVVPNDFRGLKTPMSKRTVPIFPQLHDILRAYLEGPMRPTGRLLFPSPSADGEQMITDLRKRYDLMPMPERLRRPRTEAELTSAEEERRSKLERALGKRRGPKPVESIEVSNSSRDGSEARESVSVTSVTASN